MDVGNIVQRLCLISFSPGQLKSMSCRKAKGGFFLVGASGFVGEVHEGGEGGSIWGCTTVGVGVLVSGVGCS